MLAATIIAALIYCTVQNSGVLALGTACWDERLSRSGKNNSCVASQPFLLFGHGKAIHRMDLDGKNQRRILSGLGSPILLDFHYREESVYWAVKNTGVIFKASVQGAQRQKLYSSHKHISGFAVDWIWNNIYWTSGEKGKIKTMDLNGKNERTLARHLIEPSSIVIDPITRLLFWLSGGITPSIQRCDVTGKLRTTVTKMSGELKVLTIDREDKRLFWVQFGLQGETSIASSDYNGNALHIIDQPIWSHSLGISIFLEYIYYTDLDSTVIKRVNKFTGGELLHVNVKKTTKPLEDIKVVHSLNQPIVDSLSASTGCEEDSGNCISVCSGLAEQGVCQCSQGFSLSKQGTHCEDVNECAHWNHGCSLGCENIPGSYFCTCPIGYALLPDRKTCKEITPCDSNATKCGHGCLATEDGVVCICPEGSILQEDGQSCTGCSSADRGGCSQLCTSVSPTEWKCDCQPGYKLDQHGKRCVATGPPPYLLVSSLEGIKKINPDGTEDQPLVQEPRGTITSLDYDPIHNRVFFASSFQKLIERIDSNGESRLHIVSTGQDSPEGLAIDWVHRKMYWTNKRQATVDCSSLVGQNRESVISKGLEKPTAIAVHPLAKRLFWTDKGAQPVVESASLDGTDRSVIANTNLVSPAGLTIDFAEDRLFWCDQMRAVVETSALDGSDRRVLLEIHVGQPFDLAVFEDRLWISDKKNQQLRSVHKWTGKNLNLIHGKLLQPASIVVVHPMAKPGANACLYQNGGCAQVCENRFGLVYCSCLSNYILSADGKDCLSAIATNETAGHHNTNNFTIPKDERTTMTTSELPTNKGGTDFDSDMEPHRFTDKMVSDQNECFPLRCDLNAQCHLIAGSPTCLCIEGFIGDGHSCAEVQSIVPAMTPSSPSNVNNQHRNSDSVESCPSTHESYCLYQGVCLYFPEMESYACNCLTGYMGERCQFSDLEWWELQQAEEEKRRNVVIAACLLVFIVWITIAACYYCHRIRRVFHKPAEDNVSETCVTEEDTSESSTTNAPQFDMGVENKEKGNEFTVTSCPRRAACSSCSSDSGENPMSEETGTLSKHNQGYECSMMSSVAMETTQLPVHNSRCLPSSCMSFKLTPVFHPTNLESSASKSTSGVNH